MLICQLSLGVYIYNKFSKKIKGINFNFSASKGKVTLFLILLLFCFAISALIYIHSEQSGYESTPITIPLFIVLVFISPLYEEVFFRGFVLGLIKLKFNDKGLICCFITTLLFCLFHFNSYEIYQQLNIFISGLMLFYIRDKTDGLLYPVILHASMNFFSLIMQ
ncbi:type II CAAX prenyl endopeptidase Rce1 family protein [Rahnella sp. R3(2024)]|uniref:CPBP family intramembrane glutamic endopeptidase n=1 Tax=Rahnella sp. R3(2024) TaxID=3163550 RepID=UPI0036EB9030